MREQATELLVGTPPRGLRRAFAALAHPNYRLWFFGQLVSMFGFWMQGTAQGFLVWELTRDPAYLGYVAFAAGAPSWLFMLWGGLLADRFPRRSILIVTQTVMMALAVVLTVLTFGGAIRPWHILALSFGLGVANAFDAPARMAFVMELIPRADVTNAIALNSTLFNVAVAIGPGVSGAVYAAVGPAWCFAVNAATFLPVIEALRRMRLPPHRPAPRGSSTLADLREGLRYVRGHALIRTLIAAIGMIALFGWAFITLLPAWASAVLGGDAVTHGWLHSARGIGALASALVIAFLGERLCRGRWVSTALFAFPAVVLLFSYVRGLLPALAVIAAAGFALIVLFNLINSLIQTELEDRLRGRVMSVYTLTFFGLVPIGALLAGRVAAWLGEPTTVALSAAPLLLFAALVLPIVPAVRKAR